MAVTASTPGQEEVTGAGHGRVVVGVDGSPSSVRALAWAVDWARRRHRLCSVEVVSAWTDRAWSEFVPLRGPEPNRKFELAAERAAADAVEAVEPGTVAIRIDVRYGAPVHVLLEAAVGADLLVLGSRGLGGFRELLLGSVAQQCVAHAGCPVAIVR